MNYYLKAKEWEELLKRLKGIKRIHRKDESTLRRFIEGVWYVARSGCQWRLLPPCYGSWRALHQRFKSWSDKGIWARLFEESVKDPDLEVMMTDATIVRAHACSAGYKKNSQDQEALGRSKGGFSTKIHVLVDALGNPLKLLLTPGQRNEVVLAETLTKDITKTSLIADKSYDSNAFILSLTSKACTPVIPPTRKRRIQRAYDKHLYKERHLIECFFGKIKHFRRIFSRFDKTASVFLSFLQFVSALIWFR